MKSRLSRVAAAASVVAVLGLTAACGGNGDAAKGGDKAGERPSAGQSGAAAPEEKGAPALTAAQLQKALVDGGDVKGLQFEKIDEKDYPKSGQSAKAGACGPLVDMAVFSTTPAAKARVAAGGMDEKFTSLSSVALFAHEQADAEKVLAGVRDAIGACKEFEAEDTAYDGVAEQPDPKAGDESVAYRLSGEADGEKGAIAYTVVRSGSTVLTFFSANMSGGAEVEVPKALIDTQLAKLKKATA